MFAPLKMSDVVSALTAVSNAFDKSGSGVMVVTPSGEVTWMNGTATRMDGDGFCVRLKFIKTSHPADQGKLDNLIRLAGHGDRTLNPEVIALRRPSGRQPLVVQSFPITGRGVEWIDELLLVPARAAIILTDPEANGGDTMLQLRALGLTFAEARLAQQVGTGSSPAEAAAALNINPTTARSTLKIVYGKLGIHRQSQLARLLGVLGATSRAESRREP